jgi:hypothetical protein
MKGRKIGISYKKIENAHSWAVDWWQFGGENALY